MKKTYLTPLIALGAIALTAAAQELKVDINNSGRRYTEGTDPAFTPWSMEYAWFPGGDTTSATFNGVAITFRRVGTVGTELKPSYWKNGVVDLGIKLVGDGIHVDSSDSGAAKIEMRISGLAPGPHTLLTYHNNWSNHDAFTISPLNISVNGTQTVTNLPITVRAEESSDATSAFLEFEAAAGQDVVVLFEASTAGSADKENVWINGFEIDTADSSLQAVKPSPNNGDEHVDADDGNLLLSWTAASSAVEHHVYFGTDSDAVTNATQASPEFKSSQAATNYLATDISSLRTYYWRIDEVSSGAVVTPGDVWMFRSRHLAFPGAEGYGRFARGGRDGVVVKVTNLDNSGPGSFRDAIEGDYGPRTVIFDVGGLITLESDVIINGTKPYITVAGQTAPGKGICFRKQQFALSGGDDAIVRFVRVRVGDISGEIQNGSGMSGVDHSIMDHCSISWGQDEELSSRNASNMTFQRSLISEALHEAGHRNGPSHGYAASIGGDVGSFHHNLLAHCEGRNWSMAGGLDGAGFYSGRMDIFNNVVYNWRNRTTDGGAHEVNFVNNYYKPGAATTLFTALNPDYGGFPGTQQYYMSGNVMPGHFSESNQSAGFDIGTENGGTLPESSSPPYTALVDDPFFPSHAIIHTAQNAYKQVISDVGCNIPMLDDHDTRVIQETIDGTFTYRGSVTNRPGLPDSQDDVGGWEDYGNYARSSDWDTDDDGLPNWWEEIKGLNPNSSPGDLSDSNGDPDGDEYTNLEDYLNWMAQPHANCDSGSSVNFDLDALSLGYTDNSPNYTFSDEVNGAITLVDGQYARFTPTTGVSSLGGFTYTVTDNEGETMTRALGVRILGSAVPPTLILGIRNDGGTLTLELTAESGRLTTIQSSTNLNPSSWSDLMTVTGTGEMQLLPLSPPTNESARTFLRAVTD